ncbi:MAG: hypothetical protein DHS20C19_01760 [Acidimicrobiales bacterium]|nr:MAG: hypothetical protein DHS20C19_01760 [Acidimicrobiales bacterium]
MNPQATSRRAQRVQQRNRQQRQRRLLIGLSIALAIVIAGIVVMSLGGPDDTTRTVEISMVDFGFEGNLTVEAGDIELRATNAGAIQHNIGIRQGPISGHADPGDTITLELGEVPAGVYELYCDISGHVEQGMVAELLVTEPVTETAS